MGVIIVLKWSFNLISNACKDPGRAKKFLTYYVGAEGVKDRAMGEEGKEFKVENEKLTWMNEEGKKQYSPGLLLSSVFEIKLPEADPILDKNIESAKGYALKPEISPYIGLSETNQNKGADIGKMVQEQITKIIMGELPVDAYDKIIPEVKKAGLDTILEEVNKAYKAAQK